MKKLISACAVCAVAVGVVAAPSALGVKSTKQVADVGRCECHTDDRHHRLRRQGERDRLEQQQLPKGSDGRAGVGGHHHRRRDARRDRQHERKRQVQRPISVAPVTAGTYTLKATVTGPVTRKVGSKKKGKKAKKGRQFSCLASPPASSAPVTVDAPSRSREAASKCHERPALPAGRSRSAGDR